ncbi:MAG: signal peptidase I [Myxococcota bacterium]|jgi:signal peptidase I|nr:signal peptidase I [Myxococcota bacterium]
MTADETPEKPGDEDAEGRSPGRSRLAAIWEQVSTLLVAVLIALAIRAFLVEPFRIPSGSMFPTLLIGDHLFVNKLTYGPRIPFTDIRLPGFREPERGDVVVFEVGRNDGRESELRTDIVPADLYPDLPQDDFVKRLVGLPGDRIRIRDGRLTINGVPMEQIATGEVFEDSRGASLAVRDEVLGECVHQVLDDPVLSNPFGRDREYEVPEGRYFMMGDNRDHSNDSRNWGTVRLDEMKGPAFFLYWSWDVNGNALQFFNPMNWWNADKRWSRAFSRVRCQSLEEAGLD